MPSPSQPHTTERIAVAREAHWSTRLLDFDPRPLEAIWREIRECNENAQGLDAVERTILGMEVDRG